MIIGAANITMFKPITLVIYAFVESVATKPKDGVVSTMRLTTAEISTMVPMICNIAP